MYVHADYHERLVVNVGKNSCISMQIISLRLVVNEGNYSCMSMQNPDINEKIQ